MGAFAFGKLQSREEIYGLVFTAVCHRRPVAAVYDGTVRRLCPHVLGYDGLGEHRVFCYQYGGESRSGPQPQTGAGIWRCLSLDNSRMSNCWTRTGKQNLTVPSIVFGMWRSQPKISPIASRRTDSEEVPAAASARSSSAASQLSAGYAARGGCGDPRGRNSGGGSGEDNLTFPTRAEGEKRFRSATRNP